MRQVPLLLGVMSFAACGTEPEPPPPFADKIVFLSDMAQPDEGRFLYVMNPDGSDIRQVSLPFTSGFAEASISPDGEQLAFVRDGIYTVRGDGTGLQHPLAGSGYVPAWSPDGSHLTYSSTEAGTYDIWIMNQTGNQRINLTNSSESDEFDPCWSPDGAKLVYERRPTSLSEPFQLWTIGRDGTEAEQLTNDSENNATGPAYSPDGSWIAYAWGPDYGTDIRLIMSDGTGDHSIFHSLDGSPVDAPAWAPDGKSLVFAYGLRIATIRADGSGFRVVVDSGFNADPDWGPAIQP